MKKNFPYHHTESGVVLVLVAISSVVLLGILALAVGLTFVSTQDQRMTTVTNVGALAAMDYYVSNPDSDEELRRRGAVHRANFIINQNKLLGVSEGTGYLGISNNPGEAGVVRFGKYYRSDPGDGQADSCSNVFPCFLEAQANEAASALLVDHRNQPTNPLIAPFASLLGSNEFTLRSQTATTLVNTCMAHLLDVSFSTVSGTHKPYPSLGGGCGSSACCDSSYGACDPPADLTYTPQLNATDAYLIQTPTAPNSTATHQISTASVFAFNGGKLLNNQSSLLDGFKTDYDNIQDAPDINYWVNMPNERTGTLPANAFAKSDFVHRRVNGAINHPNLPRYMLVNLNKDYRPSPLSEFMLAANVTLRILENLPAESNKGMFRAFTGDVFGRSYPGNGLTNNLSFLTQITNMNIIGDVTGAYVAGAGRLSPGSAQYPNLFDYGFFPAQSSPPNSAEAKDLVAANIGKAVFDAAQVLANNCQTDGRRMVILYTDMIPTCRFVPPDDGTPGNTPEVAPSCELEGTPPSAWNNYKISEFYILHELIPLLQEQGVSVSVVLDGPSVQPRFRNVVNPSLSSSEKSACLSGANQDPSCYLTFSQAFNEGYEGLLLPTGDVTSPDSIQINLCQEGAEGPFFSCGHPNDHEAEFNAVNNNTGSSFRRSLPLAYDLSVKTGGLFCPLMDVRNKANPSQFYVDHDGDCEGVPLNECCTGIYEGAAGFEGLTPCVYDNAKRDPGTSETPNPGQVLQRHSVEFLPKAKQAATCARKIAISNPYIQEMPLQICTTAGGCAGP